MTYFNQTSIESGGFRKFSLLKLLLSADRGYRERQHVLSLSDEALKDVGLTRSNLRTF